jgi:hypothetical protein
MFDDWWQPRAVFRVTKSPTEPLALLDVSSPAVVPSEADGAVFVTPPGPDPGHGSVGEFHVFPTASYDSLVYGDRVDLEGNRTVETPSESDEPPTVADNFMPAMPGIGFKLSFSSAKLVPGHRLAVCTILDALLR